MPGQTCRLLPPQIADKVFHSHRGPSGGIMACLQADFLNKTIWLPEKLLLPEYGFASADHTVHDLKTTMPT